MGQNAINGSLRRLEQLDKNFYMKDNIKISRTLSVKKLEENQKNKNLDKKEEERGDVRELKKMLKCFCFFLCCVIK